MSGGYDWQRPPSTLRTSGGITRVRGWRLKYIEAVLDECARVGTGVEALPAGGRGAALARSMSSAARAEVRRAKNVRDYRSRAAEQKQQKAVAYEVTKARYALAAQAMARRWPGGPECPLRVFKGALERLWLQTPDQALERMRMAAVEAATGRREQRVFNEAKASW